jgi:translocator protein
MPKIIKLFVSVGISLAAGAIGGLATSSNIPSWYSGLHKPSFNPPNEVFGPVWTVLYILMGISLFLAWTATRPRQKTRAYAAFATQLVLNALWSIVFFGLRSPVGGLIVIGLLLAAIITTMRFFWPISRPAVYLLLPYLGWVSFATVLNAAIFTLN